MLKSLRAFSLVEILIALTIMAIVALGSFKIASGYLHQVRWERLLSKVNDSYSKAHVMALSGIAQGELVDLIFLEKDRVLGAWILEAVKDGSSIRILQKTWTDFEVDPFRSESALVLRFQQPFAELSFRTLKSSLSDSSTSYEAESLSGETAIAKFFLPDTSFEKSIEFSLKKALEVL